MSVESVRETFATNLRVALAELDISQAELAKRTGLAQSTISSYVSGERYPRPTQLYLIAQALHINVSALTGIKPADESEKNELLRLYESLNAQDQDTVLSLVRFLSSERRNKSAHAKYGATVVIPRARKDEE